MEPMIFSYPALAGIDTEMPILIAETQSWNLSEGDSPHGAFG